MCQPLAVCSLLNRGRHSGQGCRTLPAGKTASRMGRKSKFVWTIRRAGSRREAPKCLPAGHRLDTDFNAVQRPLGRGLWCRWGGRRRWAALRVGDVNHGDITFGAGSSAQLLQDSSIEIYLRLPQQRQDSPRPPPYPLLKTLLALGERLGTSFAALMKPYRVKSLLLSECMSSARALS